MTVIRVIIVFIIGILLLFLASQNNTIISNVKIFYRTYNDIPLSIIMIYSFIFGLLVAGFFWLVSEIKLRHELHQQKKANEALLSELTALRNLPFDDKIQKEE
ncbi:MAG: LapA family protein [candidate division WOR-3 bacterium]